MARSSWEHRRVRYFNECCVREGRNRLCLLLFVGRHSAVWLEIAITAVATSSDMTHGILLCFCMSPENCLEKDFKDVDAEKQQRPYLSSLGGYPTGSGLRVSDGYQVADTRRAAGIHGLWV
ncbi:uncharacterized protein LOC130987036 isoform X1 [Salvia miltiorrhiza]|uniref:uncharacterized protein LOC130987036 isoform X1 n=1 Tax=Salvia miltiorrhiza TaxID=226208 RepID=UPI0025ACD4B4|nr:uncharacterized protein LOC130987036 isoform X1 [Salvia miltiorrhiza]